MSRFKPRDWQARAKDLIVAIARNGSDRALVCACPGAGKTFGTLLIANALKEKLGLGPKIIILTPNLAIKTQWIERAAVIGLRLVPVTSGADLRSDQLPFEENGFVLSYQMAVSLRHSLRQFCDAHKPIVILDEVHHTAGPISDRDGNAWGHAVELSCAPASFKLCTTGTPFREGGNPISFVNYGDDQAAVAHFAYDYSQAISDGVCRPIEFALFDGAATWIDRGEKVSAQSTDKLTKRRARQLRNALLSPDGNHPKTILEAAHRKLLEIRACGGEVDSRAAGLVVAKDVASAEAFVRDLRAITQQEPLLVHSKIDDAHSAIDAFRDDDRMWIIGIDMLSEGVDIPRLRVGAYLSDVRTALYFHQFCGRFSRVIASRDERSYVYMPSDSELEAIALEIEKMRAHALGEEFVGKLRRIGDGRGRKQSELEVIGSEALDESLVTGGVKFISDFIEKHRSRIASFRRGDVVRRSSMSDGEILKIMIDLGVIAPPGQECA